MDNKLNNKRKQDWYCKFGKRVFDLVVAIVGLLLLSPAALVVAVLILITMGSPVIFRQMRPGLHGKPFVMYKFRTMLDLRDDRGNLLPDDKRLTKLGRLLRRSSLDEIPELWNVLRGDMSIVGPRPLLMKYLPYFTEEEMKRFEVKPGITGLAVVKGRNRLSWDERLALDIHYVKVCSFITDLKLLLVTIGKVIRREDVVDLPRSVMRDLDEERRCLEKDRERGNN